MLPTTLSLTDSTATPLVFTKVDSVHGLVVYQARIDGRPDLSYQITATNPKNSNGRKGELVLTLPVIRLVDGINTRVDTNRVKIAIPLSDKASVKDRADATALTKSITGNADIIALFASAIGAQ